MKSFFILALFSLSVAANSFAGNYHLNESKIEAAFEASEDVSHIFKSVMNENLDLNLNQSVSENEKSQVTAAIIAFVVTVAGGSVASLAYNVLSIATAGFGYFIFWPILLAPLIPWHRLYLGTGGESFKVVGLYCVTLSWCGWLNIIDGIMLLVDDTESKYFDNPKYLMWNN